MSDHSKLKVFFYVQHLLGVGHVHRAYEIAKELVAQNFEVYFVNGGKQVPTVDYSKFNLIQLPPVWAQDEQFEKLFTTGQVPINHEWRTERINLLQSEFKEINPDILLIETYPFGRRFFRFELMPLLDLAFDITPRPLIVSSIRDILVKSKNPHRASEIVDILRNYFDAVLVHGDPKLISFSKTFSKYDEIKDKINYIGYISKSVDHHTNGSNPNPDSDQDILVSVGGGAVGLNLIKNAILSKKHSEKAKKLKWRILVGVDISEHDFLDLQAYKTNTMIIERARPDFLSLLNNTKLSISQAGYNTMTDILKSGCNRIVIPFSKAGENEQELRANILDELGYLKKINEKDLTPEYLGGIIDHIIDAEQNHHHDYEFDGAKKVPKQLIELYKKC